MSKQEIDRIESAIRHIQTSTDVDPWAMEIAVEAMRKQIDHIADSGKKVERTGKPSQDVSDSDLISRKAAIDAINNIMPTKEGFYEPSEVFSELMQAPSAQPERKRGKWIPWKYHDGFRCENCNEPVDDKYNFCPNCGADMRGEDKDG